MDPKSLKVREQLKWVMAVLAGFSILLAFALPVMGFVAASFILSFTLLHLYECWQEDRRAEMQVRQSPPDDTTPPDA